MADNDDVVTQPEKGPDSLQWLRRNGWNVGVLLTLLLAAAGGVHHLGKLEERTNAAHQRLDRMDSQLDAMREALDARPPQASNGPRTGVPLEDPVIFSNGTLSSGFDMGVNTSEGRTDWASIEDGYLCVNYPSGQQWGAVFITVGTPTMPPRASVDASEYRSLVIELRVTSLEEPVAVGLKDNTDPDDGSETKVPLADLSSEWQRRDIRLTRFRTADLSNLYVVTELVFGPAPAELCVRRIEFLR